jgi:diadenosine tetraphosphate (Ap4A) HIT family hydrolase
MEACNLCRADLEPVLMRDHLWHLILNHNQDLLGKCFLVLGRHEEQISNLTALEWSALHDHIRSTTQMLTQVFQPDHFNYVFHQNQDRHVHYAYDPAVCTTSELCRRRLC